MPTSKPPMYLLIEDHLREIIAAASPGDSLPSDSELCERFGVSRMTARQATQRLAAEGLLYRVSGSGTFVAQRPVHRHMTQLLSFSEEMRSRNLEPSSRILEARVRRGTDDEAVALQLRPGDRVVQLYRLRLADGTPMAVENAVLPGACAAVLSADLATGSLHTALRGLGRVPAYARGGLTALPADPEDAGLLEVAPGTPLLVERRTVFDSHDAPVEATETRYVGGRYVFDVELAHPGFTVPPRRS